MHTNMSDTQMSKEMEQPRSSESEIDDSSSTDFSENGHLLEEGDSNIREARNVIRRRWVWLCLTAVNVAVMCVTIFTFIAGRQTKISYAEAFKATQEYCQSFPSFPEIKLTSSQRLSTNLSPQTPTKPPSTVPSSTSPTQSTAPTPPTPSTMHGTSSAPTAGSFSHAPKSST